MVLHLAHHKSYHPYKAENVERVRRDEEIARLAEEADQAQTLAVDAEARLEALRNKAHAADKKRKRNEKEAGEVELEKQLNKRSKGDVEVEEKSRATIVRPEAPESQELNGHINFWADMEKGVAPTGTALPGNVDYLAEKAASQAKLERQLGVQPMYLVGPPSGSSGSSSSKGAKQNDANADLNPWYSSKDLRSTRERRKTQDQILEDAFKDTESKRTADPMALMQGYLKKRHDIQIAKEHVKNKPWDVTPVILRRDEEVHVPLLRDRRKGKHVAVAEEQEDYGPMKPPSLPVKEPASDLQTAAQLRAGSERARAKALRAEALRQKEMASPLSTPRSEISAAAYSYSGQFNKEDTRNAHRRRDGERWTSQRWDEDDRSRDRPRSESSSSRRR